MKNRKHFGIYLALLGGGLLIFVYQNNSKPYASTTATSRTATAAFPVYPASLEELTNFQSAATGNQVSISPTNVLHAAFTSTDTKSEKMTVKSSVSFQLLGSTRIKAACKTLVGEIDPSFPGKSSGHLRILHFEMG